MVLKSQKRQIQEQGINRQSVKGLGKNVKGSGSIGRVSIKGNGLSSEALSGAEITKGLVNTQGGHLKLW